MKYLLIVVALIVAVVLSALFVPLKDGTTLFEGGSFGELLESSGSSVGVSVPDTSGPTMYRWRDKYGNWQYGDVPPRGVEAEPVDIGDTRTVDPEAVRKNRHLD